MSTITGTIIDARVRQILQDNNSPNLRYASPDILDWINQAQIEICKTLPDQSAKTTGLTLVAGAKQLMPTEALLLMDITRNLGIGGGGVGRTVRPIDRKTLDAFSPTWMELATAAEISGFIYDPIHPKDFFVYPPAQAGLVVEGIYAVVPAALTSETQTLTLNDFFADMITNYVLFRLYARDSDDTNNVQASQAYYAAFSAGLKQ
jgi:uncharacterized protein DUF6682